MKEYSSKKQFSIGNVLRLRRKSTTLTQEDLAGKLGISQQHLSKIETGKINPSLELFQSIALTLNFKPSDIYKEFEEKASLILPNDNKE
ncbi:hypothetical protein BKP45_21185 [Anaerobacillus alkalidiazotrophicus]|uniref:HTH cro/C1-type domain-containing protein n=1 Tax=Anaerobacillus alkalidiazotrophicus TaxID=472963 RepID=A0A1S2LVG5_9BACI|nr:helix-turn-helix transcriptional regulator [Anaerobacillus alkalidiazotrophicus]OIJ16521.1 hypothetical protein BKP45_21185 [Anaerobacillus alkalidiazotrophicus]